MRFSSPPLSTPSSRRWRLRLRERLAMKWRGPCWACTSWPLPVFLKRLAAPRCVFIFGISTSCRGLVRGLRLALGLSCLRRLGLRLFLLGDLVAISHQDHREEAAFHARRALDGGEVPDDQLHLVELLVAVLAVHHLATPEHHRDLDLVPFEEEAARLAPLEGQVRVRGPRPELQLLQLGRSLRLARCLLLPLFVLVLPVVHDATYGRVRGGGHLDQGQARLLREGHRGLWGHHPELRPVGSDQADLAGADPLVYARRIR